MLTHEEAAKQLVRAVVELSGGSESWLMANKVYGPDRWSVREAAEVFELPTSTVHDRIKRCWDTAERFGIVPLDWYRRPPGRVPGRVVFTGKDLHDNGRLDRRRNGKTIGH